MHRSGFLLAAALLLASCGVVVIEPLPGGLPPAPGEPVPGDPAPGDPAPSRHLTRQGVFHRATVAHPVERVVFAVPPGSYRRLRLEVSVTHGGWAAANPGGTHNIFWLARNRNRNLFGYVNIRGKRELFARYGVGMPQGQKPKLATRATFRPGATYRFRYLYDAASRQVELVVLEGGSRIARLSGRADRSVIRVRRGQRFVMDFGFTGRANPNEPASLGWVWRDLEVRIE